MPAEIAYRFTARREFGFPHCVFVGSYGFAKISILNRTDLGF